MNDRRYTKEEAEQIFADAAEAEVTGHGASASGGLTLREMQEIGLEAGIAPESVARAAARSNVPPTRAEGGHFLGLPIRVGESAELDRRLTETEWENLVVMLRETFEARGSVDGSGSFRQWTNGNLQVLLEPGPNGQRLKLQTYRQRSRMLMSAGGAVFAVGVVPIVVAAITGFANPDIFSGLIPPFVIGAGLFAMGAGPLPSWAKRRRSQMRNIIDRVNAMVREPPRDGGSDAVEDESPLR